MARLARLNKLCATAKAKLPGEKIRRYRRQAVSPPPEKSGGSADTLRMPITSAPGNENRPWDNYPHGLLLDNSAAYSTMTFAFGASPKISGAYTASTRVAGRVNSPALFRRTV